MYPNTAVLQEFFWTSQSNHCLLGLRVWRELLRFYRNFSPKSQHAEKFLQIYIILLPIAPKPSETGEIAAVLQDSFFGEAVNIELLYFYRIFFGDVVHF
ncbi:hypothetical protein [Paenibacillus dendritiformis]|uniref:hypothetical protein n=1 Tax=Paenibacillus dendritiformis TaxID=130049 RepID=UPI0011B5DC11|nr:hypothetical protein [Paenibacillus dendritiformis]